MKARVDDNHGQIVKALRKIGCRVVSLASVGRGVPDLLVGLGKKLVMLEIKDGNKPPSKQKLTPDQITFHREWKDHVYIVKSVEEALDVVTK